MYNFEYVLKKFSGGSPFTPMSISELACVFPVTTALRRTGGGLQVNPHEAIDKLWVGEMDEQMRAALRHGKRNCLQSHCISVNYGVAVKTDAT